MGIIMTKYLLMLVILFASISDASTRPFRVNQVPNGSKFQCLTCHNSSSGGSRNTFGKEIESNHLTSNNSSGNVVWSAALANLDSDNDGFSNGLELLDSDGVWKAGLADPGNIENVTNPGNSNSFPVSVRDLFTSNTDGTVSIELINPNPVSNLFSLTFEVNKDGFYQIQIFDINGRVVANLGSNYYNTGKYSSTYDISMANKNIQSGAYFLSISSGKSFDFRIINFIK